MALSHYCVKSKIWQPATMSEKAQNQDKFIIRLPDGLRDRIRAAADKNHRSMNAEVVALLEENYPAPTPEKVTEPAARILLWLAERIRRRKPKPGSVRERQAALYENMASDIIARMAAIDSDNK
ncbi:Arc family DNA-binding protein [Tritonibacter mobilis]|uniref:Arc family DNA-binding protein n=1 Tax=Tritonibacter mobilis TaxID=379347 RepID=UPI001CD9A15E|nr:Arc family DNA-binding protein [Tritonibacter mobilis]MCA2007075.1 Arc family DNA-binding protein [Tritonibacter mobilis]